ncbi:MAG: ABC transporter ATP-binding protein [Castellaniella sp.]|uniref:ABC transporter ATP-binding protein n=1 Tax=Castellaniella hirudinis TaxID=1144617 RepID=A0ABV8RZG0_9BURK
MLEVEHVSKNFGGLAALSDINISVAKGETVGIIGPNGAGKTTAFNIITGTLSPSKGRVLLNGRDITGLRPSDVVKLGLARTFQNATLYPDVNVAENIFRGTLWKLQRNTLLNMLPPTRQYLDKLAEKMQLVDEIIATLELEEYRNVIARELPYGIQKKVGVAIGLATSPEILLMDEPAAGLNSKESREFGRLISKIKQHYGLTVVLVEHHIALVREISSKIIVISQGSVIAEGVPNEVLNDRRVVESYLGGGGWHAEG